MPTYLEKYGHTLITLAATIAAFIGLVTINGNRLDAQDRLISQSLDAQNELISQSLDAQNELISQLFAAVNQRLDAQDRLINQHFAAVNQRLDAQDKRLDSHDKHFDRLTDEVSELRRLIIGISERVSRNEGEIDVIREQLRIADTPSP